MAINDYSTLKQGVADWLARADLTSQIPTFIALAEARINRDLRTADMQVTEFGQINVGVIDVPESCRQVQSVRLSCGSGYKEIYPLPPERLADTTATGFPAGYVRVGNVLRIIGGTGEEDMAFTYFSAVPALSDAAPQNWLILREPGAYLYGALIEASPYLGDDARTPLWVAQYRAIIDGIMAEDASARYGNAPSMQGGLRNAP